MKGIENMTTGKKSGMTQEDIEGLKELYATLDNFHQDIKAKAQAANAKSALVVRRYFEKFLAKTSADLSQIDSRIRRAELALFRKDTKALIETEDEEAS